MNAEQTGLPPTNESMTSAQLSFAEAPLLSLMDINNQPDLSTLTPEEIRTWMIRIRNARTSVQTLRAEIQNDKPVAKSTLKKEVKTPDLGGYE